MTQITIVSVLLFGFTITVACLAQGIRRILQGRYRTASRLWVALDTALTRRALEEYFQQTV